MNRKDESLAMQILAHREADRLRAENENLRATLKQTQEALRAAQTHLDFCGWGDRYERECAEATNIVDRIDAALKAADETLKALNT